MADARTKEKEPLITPARVSISIVLLVGAMVAAWLTFGPRAPAPRGPVLTQEGKDYLPNLKLSEVQPQTSENYINQSLFEILGKITNNGPRTLASVQVTCVFRNWEGKEIHRELGTVVSAKNGVLEPGKTGHFRLAFDDIPDGWNRQMPDLVIAEIGFR